MSEPNKTRTIPLHIADQAVAACEAEIQKLKEENARLKDKSACQTECLNAFDKKLREAEAEVERLRIAGTYLCSTMEVNGIHDNGDIEMHERAIALWNAAKEGKPSA